MTTAFAETDLERYSRLVGTIAQEAQDGSHLGNRILDLIDQEFGQQPTRIDCDHPKYLDGHCVTPGCPNHNIDAVRTTEDWPW